MLRIAVGKSKPSLSKLIYELTKAIKKTNKAAAVRPRQNAVQRYDAAKDIQARGH
jgi:hypothetical protein